MSSTSLQHFGVLGMKWGKRKSPAMQTTQKITRSKKTGKSYLVTKTKFGDTVSKKQVSAKEAKAFVEKQKAQKLAERYKNQEANTRAIQAGKIVAWAISAYSMAKLYSDFFGGTEAAKIRAEKAAYQEWLRTG